MKVPTESYDFQPGLSGHVSVFLQISESGVHERALRAALALACVAVAGADCCLGWRVGAAGATKDEGRRANTARLACVGGVGDAVGIHRAGAAVALAARYDGCGVEFAAEHYCCGGG